jgi:hypothetical protein
MSRSARIELITSLITLGVLNPETEKSMILGALGLGDSFTVLDGYASDRARQWREIQDIISGRDVNPIESENHEVHISMIKKFIASGKRDSVSPEMIRKINEHRDGHEKLQALELAKKTLYLQQFMGEIQNATTPATERPGSAGGSRQGNGASRRQTTGAGGQSRISR